MQFLEMESGKENVSAAWYHVLHINSRVGTINGRGEKGNILFFIVIVATGFISDISYDLSPVLPKGSIILLHGLDLRVLVSIFFLFHCGCHTIFSFTYLPIQVTKLVVLTYTKNLAVPGYLPPLFLLMKQTMRSTRISRAMAHISPMNQPCVAMSICRLGTAGNAEKTRNREKDKETAEMSVQVSM